MQYLLSTDLLLDALEEAGGGREVLALCRNKQLKGWALSSSAPVLYERIRRNRDDDGAKRELKRLLEGITLLPQTADDIRKSLDAGETNFEAGLAVAAVRAFGLDGVVTLRAEAFAGAGIKTVAPEEVLKLSKTGGETASRVPLLDVPASYHEIWEDAERELAETIRSGQFILGPQVSRLEEKIAKYCQCKYAVGVSSGTDALLISLMAAGIGPGDEVVTTPFTFFATAGSIARVGARPAFVDIDPATYNIDPGRIEEKITPKTKAIMPVHLYGQCADMEPILEIAKRRGLIVIEDAAQAIGSEYKGRKTGSMGDYGCFSFFPTKNLGGFGDGGMVTASSEELFEKLTVLRAHGSKPKYFHKVTGGNFRLDTLQAAAVLAKFKHLEGWTGKRRENARRYDRLFAESRLRDCAQIPRETIPGHVYNQYVIRVKGRNELRKYLQDKKIQTEIYYPLPLHLQECFASLGYRRGDFPESEKAAEETLALPVYPEITPEQQSYVVRAIQDFFA